MGKIKRCMLFWLFLSVLAACGGQEAATGFSKDDLLMDFDYLWVTLEENFPSLEAFDQADYGPQTDWRAWRDQQRQFLKDWEGTHLSHLEAARFFNETLLHFSIRGHLYLYSPETISNFLAASARGSMSLQLMAQKLNQPAVQEFYETLAAELEQEQLTMVSILPPTLAEFLDRDFEIWVENDVAYLRFSSFLLADFDDLFEFHQLFHQSLTEAAAADHLIIDIRNNMGGNSFFGMMLMEAFWQEPLSWEFMRMTQMGGINRHFADVGSLNWQVQYENTAENRARFGIENLYVDHLDYILIEEIQLANQPESAIGFTGDVWLLTDGGFSAADWFAHAAKTSGFATLVGRPGGGSGIILPSKLFILPQTGMAISYDSTIGFNDDGTVNTIIGVSPHILLEEGQDALDYLLDLIKRD